ncbi:MAG: hypothetical protein KGL39_53700, partial [Patescibacteria group bacterium]|nr:hypothetical protein [Patescibacteria group bacterium]
ACFGGNEMTLVEGAYINVRIRGQKNGLEFEFEEVHKSDPPITIDEFNEMVDFYSVGFGLGRVQASASPAPQQQPYSGGSNHGGNGNGGGEGFRCAVHGNENIKFSDRFQRFECKVRSPQPAPWANDKPWVDNKTGQSWYYCRSQS